MRQKCAAQAWPAVQVGCGAGWAGSRRALPARPLIWMYSPLPIHLQVRSRSDAGLVRHDSGKPGAGEQTSGSAGEDGRAGNNSKAGRQQEQQASAACLFSSPSHLRRAVNTHVRAGMFSPMAKVSVLNRHCRHTGGEAGQHRHNCCADGGLEGHQKQHLHRAHLDMPFACRLCTGAI